MYSRFVLGLALLATVAPVAAKPPLNPGPVGKIDPSKIPPLNNLPNKKPPQLLILPKIATQITYPAGVTQAADGSWSVHSTSTTYRVTSPTADTPGAVGAVKLEVTRADAGFCPLDKPATFDKGPPALTTGTAQGGQLVAEIKVSGDYYLLAGKCPSGGQVYRAEVTFTSVATAANGFTTKKVEVVKLTGFLE